VPQIQQFLYDNSVTQVNDSEIRDLIKYFSPDQYLTVETFEAVVLTCEDKILRKMARNTFVEGPTARAVDRGMLAIIVGELNM
jgi:hypothetical protein